MYVYVAGPYSADPEQCTRRAIAVADDLIELGAIPFVPHLTHLWEQISPKQYEQWMDWDFKWLDKCDCLVRIPGHSPGSDREVERMKAHGRPIYHWPEDSAAIASAIQAAAKQAALGGVSPCATHHP